MAEEKNKKPRIVRQEWKPHWTLRLLYRIWMVVFSAVKIAVGAAATVLIIGIVCGFVFVGILGDYIQSDIVPEAVFDLGSVEKNQNSYLYYLDSDGSIQELRRVYASTNSEWVPYADIPEKLVHAAVAIEDKRFYEHQGVDWITTIKACARMFFGDDSKGGSTITQQLIKNITGDNSVTVQRKVQEICKGTYCEKKYGKDTIMEWYLNRIYFGQRCQGIKTAAAKYFGKELESLTVAECASLISITNNPSIYDPYSKEFMWKGQLRTGYERNAMRKEDTLNQMREQGWITEEEYEEAMAQEIVLKDGIDFEDKMAKCLAEGCGYRGLVKTFTYEDDKYYCPNCGTEAPLKESTTTEVYSWFEDTVLEEVAMALAERDGIEWNRDTRKTYMEIISRSGYHIYTTLNKEVQEAVDVIYTDLDEIPDTRSGQQLQSAIVIVDNATGDVVAMAGGVGEKVIFDDWNCATDAKLQTGSSIKPLTVYAPAFELGVITPATVIKDMPYEYNDGAPWPKNDNRMYSYSKSIRTAVVGSVNAVAVNTLDIIGAGYSYQFAKEKFGLSTLTNHYVTSSGQVKTDENMAALALGAQTVGISVRDMTCAFATFANDGVYRRGRTYTKVYDSEGNLVLDNAQYSEDILSHKAVEYMNYCLVDAANVGTGSNGIFKGSTVAAKTGTTSNAHDRWYCGYTKYYTASVWCGYKVPEPIQLVGDYSNPAGRLFRKVMQPIHQGLPNAPLYNASNFKSIKVCLDSGMLATDACMLDPRIREENEDFTRVETVKVYKDDENVPTETCTKHVLVDYCVSGNGVASEYCKLFAEENLTVVEKRALVKMTLEEIEEIRKAEKFGLHNEFKEDGYIYFIQDNGADAIFKGLHGDKNEHVDAPYVVCPVHTKEVWENYIANKEPEPPVTEPTEPTAPTAPTEPQA